MPRATLTRRSLASYEFLSTCQKILEWVCRYPEHCEHLSVDQCQSLDPAVLFDALRDGVLLMKILKDSLQIQQIQEAFARIHSVAACRQNLFFARENVGLFFTACQSLYHLNITAPGPNDLVESKNLPHVARWLAELIKHLGPPLATSTYKLFSEELLKWSERTLREARAFDSFLPQPARPRSRTPDSECEPEAPAAPVLMAPPPVSGPDTAEPAPADPTTAHSPQTAALVAEAQELLGADPFESLDKEAYALYLDRREKTGRAESTPAEQEGDWLWAEQRLLIGHQVALCAALERLAALPALMERVPSAVREEIDEVLMTYQSHHRDPAALQALWIQHLTPAEINPQRYSRIRDLARQVLEGL
ncbi:hypothetical protein PAPYR_7456 [Paratrimastix pyriformis]|uniref:Calponin-homology (CH) domain-containing protein n=1 Tax=Paratrimastix pyriformis TaxID=342808 RepID=A0ABQ8UIQ5_9EUKA|nr:hypothetical protein PAPYR_7456 [Paratrimastix pyriformis]